MECHAEVAMLQKFNQKTEEPKERDSVAYVAANWDGLVAGWSATLKSQCFKSPQSPTISQLNFPTK
jgi:hypothetical protein